MEYRIPILAAATVAEMMAFTRFVGLPSGRMLAWASAGLFAVNWLLMLLYLVAIYPVYFSPLRNVPGPKAGHWLLGNFKLIHDSEPPYPQAAWMMDNPDAPIIRYRGLFNIERIMLCSIESLRQILQTNTYEFPKPEELRKNGARILGMGVLFAEGAEHRRQRKALMPAFSFTHIKRLVPYFWDKSNTLVECLQSELNTSGDGSVIEMQSWLTKATLDIIGVTGFGFDFDSLHRETEVVQAYNIILMPTSMYTRILGILNGMIPIMQYVPLKRNLEVRQAIKSIHKICDEMIEEKMQRVKSGNTVGDDILAIIASQGEFTKREMREQVMTFLVAGHETTATATTWALHFLSKYPEMQHRLREEVNGALADVKGPPTFDTIDKLTYLAHFTQEVLRYMPPVAVTFRESSKDCVIEGYSVPKGTTIIIANAAIQKDERLWGPTAKQFDPDRWVNPPESNYAFSAFLNGPHGCIGRK